MGLEHDIAQTQKEEDEFSQIQQAKMGDYVDIDCPNCNRHRVMLGDDGKHRCEKCYWCIEDNNYDSDFSRWSR